MAVQTFNIKGNEIPAHNFEDHVGYGECDVLFPTGEPGHTSNLCRQGRQHEIHDAKNLPPSPSEVIKGDLHHNIQPVIGWLRLAAHDDKPLTQAQVKAAIEKLYLALEAADKL